MAIHPRRSLATHTAVERHDTNMPWDMQMGPGIHHLPPSSSTPAPRIDVTDFLRTKPRDPQDILLIGNPTYQPSKKYRSFDGVGGEISEMYAVLHGCFCVGRMKRAEAIISRLTRITEISHDELMAIHLEFIRVSVERILLNPDGSDTQSLHKWFELNVRQQYDFDYAFLAYMLKVSLREPSTQKRNRLVTRYMDLQPPNMSSDDQKGYGILTEKELELIKSILQGNRQVEADYDEELVENSSVSADQTALPAVGKQNIPDEVRSVEQKGLGLKTLKVALSAFRDGSLGFDPSSLTFEQRKERQARIEEGAVRSAIDRWREENGKLAKIGMNTALQTKNLGARMWKWQLAMEEYVKKELEKLDALEADGTLSEEQLNLSIWLRYLPYEQLAAITILATMNKTTSQGLDKGVPLSSVIMHIGEAIEEESLVRIIAKETKTNPTLESKKKHGFLIRTIKRKNARAAQRLADNPPGPQEPPPDTPFHSMSLTSAPWSPTAKAHIGAFLATALLKTATLPVTRVNPDTGEHITQVQPAFSHTHQYRMGKKLGVILVNTALVEQLKREPVHSLLARHLPMIVEPAPWTKFNSGGYIAHPTKAIRIKSGDKDQRHYAEAAAARGDLDQVFKGLDVLGKTSWQINKGVFDTMLEAWNSGEAIANMPAAQPQLDMPIKPDNQAHPDERRKYIRAIKSVENTRAGLHSQRCFQNFQLEIARTLRNETFYFPHNVDFRGRAYPVPPLLNHMGADHCRGLLMFGEARALGESGLRWLKIHLANVYGFDKASLSEREGFADKHMDEIYDSATNPLQGKRWWLNSEDPWQTLAACLELKNALDSADPTKYMSCLPVHQDGTCNGLQHYAALGGDEWGAKQVNLEPGDKPADVYTAVADLVIKNISKDLANGNPLAKILDGKINRKVVKQTVMTNVYGVTFVGARTQVRKQLVAAHKDLPNGPDIHTGHLASYVAFKIFDALSTMFKGAHEIQHWFGECASRISSSLTPEQLDRFRREFDKFQQRRKNGAKYKTDDSDSLLHFKSAVVWTTPLHMPVVQPYRVSKARLVKTCLQQISLTEPHRSDPVSKRKQVQGFPPNFVHSLDATHMMLSALQCYDMGLSFAAVHDSFWTHAADVDKMNHVLRDAFIKIHSEDVVGRLAEEFKVRYKGCYQLVKVKPGSPMVSKIQSLRRTKEFRELKNELLGNWKGSSAALGIHDDKRAEELLVELKVAEMLQSTDPETVAKAQKMQTPGRLFDEMAKQEDFEEPEELADIGVGKIPTRGAKLKAGKRFAMAEGDEEPFDLDASDEELASDAPDESEDEELLGAVAKKTTPIWEPSPKNLFVDALEKKGRATQKNTYTQASSVWVPLRFPPVPKRVRCIIHF